MPSGSMVRHHGESQPGSSMPRRQGQPRPAITPAARFWGNDAASRPKIHGDQPQKLAFLNVLDQIARYGDGLNSSQNSIAHGSTLRREPSTSSGARPIDDPGARSDGPLSLLRSARTIRRRKKPCAWAGGWPTNSLPSTKLARETIRTGSPLRSGAVSSSAARARPSPRSCT